MRTFEQLIEPEQKAAVEYCLCHILQGILEGAIRFNDKLNEDALQATIDKALDKADDMQTPWFAGEYVMEAVGDRLRGIARCDAEDAQYADADDGPIIRLTGTPVDGFKAEQGEGT